jgi:hypothetical protein
MKPLACSSPSAEGECHKLAVYNNQYRCCGAKSRNYCWEHLGPMLTGIINAWQDGIPPCPHCGMPRTHLEDVILLTSVGPGMTIGEAWDEFNKEIDDQR